MNVRKTNFYDSRIHLEDYFIRFSTSFMILSHADDFPELSYQNHNLENSIPWRNMWANVNPKAIKIFDDNIYIASLSADKHERVIELRLCIAESKCADHKNELTSFIHFEELLLKYFENADHFTVVPKIVFLDVDVHALNNFLMRDRPGEQFIIGFKNSDYLTFERFQNLPLRSAYFAVVRRNKVVGNNYGLLYRDVAFLPKQIYMGKTINGEFKDSPTICIEIKAKQGYAMDDDDGKFDVKKCRFCYFQVRLDSKGIIRSIKCLKIISIRLKIKIH